MSSFLCFLCHSTVNSETNEDIRDKYREVVGLHLCLDSHLCFICCHMVNKLCLFRSMCLKRSLEYPVLFSEKGTLNLQKSDLDTMTVCRESICKQTLYSINKSLYANFNSKSFIFNYDKYGELYDTGEDDVVETSQYVELEDERKEYDNNCSSEEKNYVDFDDKNAINKTNDKYNIGYEEGNCHTSPETCYEENQQSIDPPSPTNSINGFNGSDKNDEIPETKEFIDDGNHVDQQNENNSATDITDLQNEETDISMEDPKKKHKNKKIKKKSFKKIVLSLKEQKAVLEAQRKEKKYIEAEFKCHSCALGFLFKDTYQSHMVRHEESNGQYFCNICKLRFATQNAKCMHVALHSEVYRCNNCLANVKRPHKARHRRDCWGVGLEQCCHLCRKTFRDANCLQQHLKRFHAAKSSQRIYTCNVCGKTYTDQRAVRTHMLKHINRRFECDQCPASYKSPYTLNQHKKRHRSDQPVTQFHCSLCNTWYGSEKNYLAHCRNTLRHQQTSYVCVLCTRKFPSERALNVHAQSHGTRRFPCACGAVLPTRRALTNHSRTHRPRPLAPALCHLCGAVFKSPSKLNRHLKEVCERAKLEEELASYYEQDGIMG